MGSSGTFNNRLSEVRRHCLYSQIRLGGEENLRTPFPAIYTSLPPLRCQVFLLQMRFSSLRRPFPSLKMSDPGGHGQQGKSLRGLMDEINAGPPPAKTNPDLRSAPSSSIIPLDSRGIPVPAPAHRIRTDSNSPEPPIATEFARRQAAELAEERAVKQARMAPAGPEPVAKQPTYGMPRKVPECFVQANKEDQMLWSWALDEEKSWNAICDEVSSPCPRNILPISEKNLFLFLFFQQQYRLTQFCSGEDSLATNTLLTRANRAIGWKCALSASSSWSDTASSLRSFLPVVLSR